MGSGEPSLTMALLRDADPEKDWQVYNRFQRILHTRWKRDVLSRRLPNLNPDMLRIHIGMSDTAHKIQRWQCHPSPIETGKNKGYFRICIEFTQSVCYIFLM